MVRAKRRVFAPGLQVNNWTIMERLPNSNKVTQFMCKCVCGNERVIGGNVLKRSNSCGCINNDYKRIQSITSHGKCRTPAYGSWMSMKQRCLNEKQTSYIKYGGRGITICDRWLESFENFYEDMGDRPEGKTLDRIDNEGNYEPSNCRWATNKEQSNNTRVSRKFDINGEMMTAYDISKVIGIPQNKIISYFNRGYTIAQMVHFEEKGINPSLKRVVKISPKTGNVLEIYDTALEAGRENIITPGSISKCCRGLEYHNTAGGYKWEFYDEEKHSKQDETVFNYSIPDDDNTLSMPLKYYICGDKTEYYLK